MGCRSGRNYTRPGIDNTLIIRVNVNVWMGKVKVVCVVCECYVAIRG